MLFKSTTMKNLLLLILSLVIYVFNIQSQNDVKIIGHLVNQDDEKLKSSCVYLYQENQRVDSVITKKNGKFSFYLYRNKNYTIEMITENYAPKKVAINTAMPEDAKLYEDVEFIMEMIPMVSGVDYSELDFPVAIIEYSEKKHQMIFVSSYTKAMKLEQKKISEEVKMAQKNN